MKRINWLQMVVKMTLVAVILTSVTASVWAQTPEPASGGFSVDTMDTAQSPLGLIVDGVCEAGSCPARPIPIGGSTFLSINVIVTLANGDMFQIVGHATAQDLNGGFFLPGSSNYYIMYLGDGHGGVSQADTLSLSSLVAFDSPAGSANFGEGAVGFFSPNIAAASKFQRTSFENGDCQAPILGPFTPAGGSFNATASYSCGRNNFGFEVAQTDSILFGEGSAPGSFIAAGLTPSN